MKVIDVVEKLEQVVPKSLALSWDNVGLLVGDANANVKRILLTLDVSDEAVKYAVDNQVDLIISHHPLIFGGCKQVVAQDFIGGRIMTMIENHIACYAAHTNFDVTYMGETVSNALGLCDLEVLDVTAEADVPMGIGHVGTLSQAVTLQELAAQTKEKFQLSAVKVFGDAERRIQRVAVVPGSGKSEIAQAIQLQADVLITGDIDHHAGIDAVAEGLCIIDAGHAGLESTAFITCMQNILQENLLTAEKIEIQCLDVKEPFWYVS